MLNISATPAIYPEERVQPNEPLIESMVRDGPNEPNEPLIESMVRDEPNEPTAYSDDITPFLDKLDKEGFNKLTNLHKTLPQNATTQDVSDALMNIMKSGADEFKQKNGRNMTYSEMRYAYG